MEQTETSVLSNAVVGQPDQQTVDPQVLEIITGAFGGIERDNGGTIVGVDLAQARASVSDEVLNAALTIRGLKKLRVAGSGISRETLVKIADQTKLEELFLQDTVINNDDLAVILAALPQWKRLTLRRCANVTDDVAESFLARNGRRESLHGLRNLALIEMSIGRTTLETLAGLSNITALDLRDCSRLVPEDYALLADMPQLVDLKIGGFGINDAVLKYVAPLPNLTGLTVEDAMISPDGFARMLETAAWKSKLTQLVLSRNSMLFDDGLLPIHHLPKLKRLTVNGMMVTGRFLAPPANDESRLPPLEALALRKSLLTGEGAMTLRKYRELKSLDLSGVAMTEELVEIIATLDTLETLNLSECRLTDEMVLPFRRMPGVKSLVLTGNPLSVEPNSDEVQGL
ncbi:MAG: hypothetical protein FWD31_09625 [Planctomycetaceae bacterium]|nr:hypothetical protein [Planctomycetaceae bacterium]